MNTAKEIMIETLTHVFYMDGTKEAKIDYNNSPKSSSVKTTRIKSIELPKGVSTAQDVDNYLKSFNAPAGTVFAF